MELTIQLLCNITFLIPCLAASFAPKAKPVPEPNVKAPAIIDNRFVGSDTPASA